MSDDKDDTKATPRTPPDGSAWREAQRGVADRNDAARKAGKERSDAHDKKVAALRRAEREKGIIFR